MRASSARESSKMAEFQALQLQATSAIDKNRKAAGGGRHMTDEELFALPMANKFALPYVSDGKSGRADATDKEILELLEKHNMAVYETRVAKAYVNEVLARDLYKQKVQEMATARRQQHRDVVARQRSIVASVLSPRTRKLRLDGRIDQSLAHMMEEATPRFHDIDTLRPQWDEMSLLKRGLPEESSSIAHHATPIEISRAVGLPPISSLMNPRNQMTSPLPDLQELKRDLLPVLATPAKSKSDAPRKLGPLGLDHLSALISRLTHQKRTADVALRQEMDLSIHEAHLALVPMTQIVETFMGHEYGNAKKFITERTEQLRLSCHPMTGHGSNPRVAMFRRLACLEGDPPWPPKQENVCMQMLSWLRVATDDPAPRYTTQLLEPKDMRKLADHLVRLHLIPADAKAYYYQLGEALRIGARRELSSPPPASVPPPASPPPRAPPGITDEVTADLGENLFIPGEYSTHRSPSRQGGGPQDGPSEDSLSDTPRRSGSPSKFVGKIDADELLLTWMAEWEGWVDEVMTDDYRPEM